ncbi:unnamed protein product [Phytomonas sp. EM1]|nr:unnamed protein product [Phytomonas sp. EM1]|eukprot:CCW63561.1 unnamed protein product [Phytomonas sp. isolate EM1]
MDPQEEYLRKRKQKIMESGANRSRATLSCNTSSLPPILPSIQDCSAREVLFINEPHATDEEDGDDQSTPRYIPCSAQYALAANAVYVDL